MWPTSPDQGHAPAGPASTAGNASPAAKAALAHSYTAAPFGPTSRLLGALGRARSVKARLTH